MCAQYTHGKLLQSMRKASGSSFRQVVFKWSARHEMQSTDIIFDERIERVFTTVYVLHLVHVYVLQRVRELQVCKLFRVILPRN